MWLALLLHVKLGMKIPVRRELDFSDYFLPPQFFQTHLPLLNNLMATPVRSRRSLVIWLLRMIGYTSISVAVVTLVISWFRQFRKRIPRDDGRANSNGTSLRRRSSEMNGIDVISFSPRGKAWIECRQIETYWHLTLPIFTPQSAPSNPQETTTNSLSSIGSKFIGGVMNATNNARRRKRVMTISLKNVSVRQLHQNWHHRQCRAK